jgi:hypothetical protein
MQDRESHRFGFFGRGVRGVFGKSVPAEGGCEDAVLFVVPGFGDGADESKPWIIMLSGMADVKQVRRGYELGARTFINKPLRAEEVSEFLENNRGTIRRQMTSEGYQLHWM